MNSPEFSISRTFDASRKKLWEAWTVPEIMAKWWGPRGFNTGYFKMDFRPGGIYHYCMKAPDGSDMWGKFTYQEITAPEKIIYINSFSDAEGNITRHPFSPNWPHQMLSTILLEELNGKTILTIKWIPLNAEPQELKTFEEGRAGMQQGWGGTLDRLEHYLTADQ